MAKDRHAVRLESLRTRVPLEISITAPASRPANSSPRQVPKHNDLLFTPSALTVAPRQFMVVREELDTYAELGTDARGGFGTNAPWWLPYLDVHSILDFLWQELNYDRLHRDCSFISVALQAVFTKLSSSR